MDLRKIAANVAGVRISNTMTNTEERVIEYLFDWAERNDIDPDEDDEVYDFVMENLPISDDEIVDILNDEGLTIPKEWLNGEGRIDGMKAAEASFESYFKKK